MKRPDIPPQDEWPDSPLARYALWMDACTLRNIEEAASDECATRDELLDEALALLADSMPDPAGVIDAAQWHRRMDRLADQLAPETAQDFNDARTDHVWSSSIVIDPVVAADLPAAIELVGQWRHDRAVRLGQDDDELVRATGALIFAAHAWLQCRTLRAEVQS